MKDKIIEISNELTNIKKEYEFQITKEIKTKKNLNSVANIINNLIVANRALTSVVFYINRMESHTHSTPFRSEGEKGCEELS